MARYISLHFIAPLTRLTHGDSVEYVPLTHAVKHCAAGKTGVRFSSCAQDPLFIYCCVAAGGLYLSGLRVVGTHDASKDGDGV
jgi:hypothetical protein